MNIINFTMTLSITIYSKDNCPMCVQAKQLLNSKELNYKEFNVEKTPSAATFLTEKYPAVRQMPAIFINNQYVGGLAGLQAALKQVGL